MLKNLMSNPFQKELSEGKHNVVLTNAAYHEDKKDAANDYLCLEMLIDNELRYKRNMFERDVSIFLSHTRRQLNRQNETIVPMDYIKDLISNKTELELWVAYPVVPTKNGPKRVQNIYWLEPTMEMVSEGATTDDAELPTGV